MSLPSRIRPPRAATSTGRLATAVLGCCTVLTCLPVKAASDAPVAAEHGMVVSAQALATRVGVDVLKKGGNAIDAAVAVGYALAVVYPAAGNLGGGGFMTIELADGRKTFLDFREKAPLAATANMYLDAKGDVLEGLSTIGYLAAAVPGSVAGLEYARSHYGKLPRAALIAPAIRLAEQGFTLEQGDIDILNTTVADLKRDPAAAAIFLKEGRPFVAGERLYQRDLGRSLRLVSQRGASGFYKGSVAAQIVAASGRGHGIISQADLDQYSVRELRPIECNYRGYRIISAPPPSSGGVTICEILNILEGYPLAQLGYHSAQALHYEIEAMRHAYVDRNAYLGDPDFVANPLTHLLDKAYAAELRAAINPERAGVSADIRPGVAPHEGRNTTHYCVVDAAGNSVSVTYTLNDWFGAKVVPAGTGVLLNDEMDDFTAKVGVPNMYGLVQGEANAIAAGKRPLSSMSPTIVERDGKPVLVVGTPGGSVIITAVLQTIINMIDFGMNVQEAVDAPRIHQQWLPDVTLAERFAINPDTARLLEAKGQKLGPPQDPNHLEAISIGAPSLGGEPVGAARFYGANDPRRNTGLAQGF